MGPWRWGSGSGKGGGCDGQGDFSQATRKIIISQVIIGFAIQMREDNADTKSGLKSSGFL